MTKFELVVHAILFAITSAVFLFLDGQLWPASITVRRSISCLFLLLCVVSRLPRFGRQKSWYLASIALLSLFAITLQNRSSILIHFVLVLSCFALLADPFSRQTNQRSASFVQVLILVMFFWLSRFPEFFPPLSNVIAVMENGISNCISEIFSRDIQLGSSAIGLHSLSLVLIALLVRGVLGDIKIFSVVNVFLVVVVGWVFALLCAHGMSVSKLTQFLLPSWILTIASVVINIDCALRPNPASSPKQLKLGSERFVFSCVIIVTGLITMVVVNTDHFLPSSGRAIAVHNRGGIDWDVTTFDNRQGGMFGQLPKYLKLTDINLNIIDKDKIERSDLDEIDTLILINSSGAWDSDQKNLIFEFVSSGGTLLVFGDHTDVFGLQSSFNSLLDGVGIRFNFDSAYHVTPRWPKSVISTSGILECSWESVDPGIAIGASLNVSGWATPILVGKFGFSDHGERENVVGSYLGNYSWDEGERLGDVSLVAKETLGNGKIVVFGDTSSLQGDLSAKFEEVVVPLLESCLRPASLSERWYVRVLAGILLLVLLFILAMRSFGELFASILTSALVLTITLLLQAKFQTDVRPTKQTVLLGNSHLNKEGHYSSRLNSTGPLKVSLLRSGFLPLSLQSWNREKLLASKAICFVAPQRRFSHHEIEDLVKFEESGGITILACGLEDCWCAKSLLKTHGLDFLNKPMGTVTFAQRDSLRSRSYPKLLDAWPIVSSTAEELSVRKDVTVLLEIEESAVVVFVRLGQGGLLLFSDTRYFSSQNIEDFPDFVWEGNVEFIKQALIKFLDAKPDQVGPVYKSPEMPK